MRVDFPFDGDLIISDDTTIDGVVRGSAHVRDGTTIIERDGMVLRDLVVVAGRVLVHGSVGGDVINHDGDVVIYGSVRGTVEGHRSTTRIDPGALTGLGGPPVTAPSRALADVRFEATTPSPIVESSTSRLRSRVADVRRAQRLRFLRHGSGRLLAVGAAFGLLVLAAGGVLVSGLLDSKAEPSTAVLGRTESQGTTPPTDSVPPATTVVATSELLVEAPATTAVRLLLAGLLIDDASQPDTEFLPGAFRWTDSDGDCRMTDTDVAVAASTGVTAFSLDWCTVVTGTWVDGWTGEAIPGPGDMVVEPIVPFENVHEAGGWAWSPVELSTYANETEPGDLFVVAAATAAEREAAGSIAWEPSEDAACAYASAWINKKARWSLSVTSNEAAMLGRLLDRCGNGDEVFDIVTP